MNSMNTTLRVLGVTTIVAAGVFFSAGAVGAYRGDVAVQGPNYTLERHNAMEKAFENNDFTAWKSLMQGRGRVTQLINKENFAKFAKAHQLAEDGKLVEASQIRQELGLGVSGRKAQGAGMGRWHK